MGRETYLLSSGSCLFFFLFFFPEMGVIGGQQGMYGEEQIMPFCLLMASAVVSCTGKSQRTWLSVSVWVRARVCVCVVFALRPNGTANRKLGTPGPSAPCHGSHVTLWQQSIIDSHRHIRFCVHTLFVFVRVCTCAYIAILWTANNWFALLHPLLRVFVCLRLCVFTFKTLKDYSNQITKYIPKPV